VPLEVNVPQHCPFDWNHVLGLGGHAVALKGGVGLLFIALVTGAGGCRSLVLSLTLVDQRLWFVLGANWNRILIFDLILFSTSHS
jgi:hypothetical protein